MGCVSLNFTDYWLLLKKNTGLSTCEIFEADLINDAVCRDVGMIRNAASFVHAQNDPYFAFVLLRIDLACKKQEYNKLKRKWLNKPCFS